jgi:hypothetical protein
MYFKYGTNGTCSGTLISHKVVFDNNVEQTVWAIKTHPTADLAVLTISGIPAGSAQAPIKIHTPATCDDPDPTLLRTTSGDARAHRSWILQ